VEIQTSAFQMTTNPLPLYTVNYLEGNFYENSELLNYVYCPKYNENTGFHILEYYPYYINIFIIDKLHVQINSELGTLFKKKKLYLLNNLQ